MSTELTDAQILAVWAAAWLALWALAWWLLRGTER
jgi:hypothetical protein